NMPRRAALVTDEHSVGLAGDVRFDVDEAHSIAEIKPKRSFEKHRPENDIEQAFDLIVQKRFHRQVYPQIAAQIEIVAPVRVVARFAPGAEIVEIVELDA